MTEADVASVRSDASRTSRSADPEVASCGVVVAEGAPAPAGAGESRERLSANLGWNLGADLAARGASLWLSFICARLLGVEGFGRLSFALTAAQYAWLVGDASLNGGYATRETARARGTGPAQAGLFWSTRLLAALAITAIYLTVICLAPVETTTRRVLAAAATFFLAYAAFPDWALRGIEDFRGLALGNTAYAASLVATILLLLPSRPDPALAVALWGGCFGIAALVTLPRLVRRGVLEPRPAFSRAAWWPHARRSSMFSLGSVAAIGYTQLPILLTGMLLGPREVGLFSAGFRILLAFIGALSVLWWPLMPVLTREQPGSPAFRDVLVHSATLVLALSVPVALALTVFAPGVLQGMFGPGYAAGAMALAIGAWVLPLYALGGLLEQTSLALDREGMRAGVAGTALGAMIALGALLVPRFGVAGAAATSFAGFALALGLYAVRLRSHIQLGDVFRPLARVGAACVPLAGFWMVVPRLTPLPLGVSLVIGAVLYLPLALRLGLLRLAPGSALLTHSWLNRRTAEQVQARPKLPRELPRGPLPEHPSVSVILAVRNEEGYITRAVEAVSGQSYPCGLVEILVVDGESSDRTLEIVKELGVRDPRVRVLHNPLRRVAGGLNLGLRAARGEVVVRVDGHCVIPPDYLATCIRMLRAGGVDCAGGPVRAEGETLVGRAIAMAMSTPFGVGGASFRWADSVREVDHLPFGAWRRELFQAIGLFDETLERNQDDELSDRLRRHGGRIVMDPSITSRYFSRNRLSGLWRQYFGYGFWKVRGIRKRGGWPASFRHVVPATFVCGALGALALSAMTRSWIPVACVLGPYVAFLAIAAATLTVTRRRLTALLVPAALVIMHVAYGAGFMAAVCSAGRTRQPIAPATERRAA